MLNKQHKKPQYFPGESQANFFVCAYVSYLCMRSCVALVRLVLACELLTSGSRMLHERV